MYVLKDRSFISIPIIPWNFFSRVWFTFHIFAVRRESFLCFYMKFVGKLFIFQGSLHGELRRLPRVEKVSFF